MLKTVDEIVSALGGTVAVAHMVGIDKAAVSNWKARGCIPSHWYFTIGLLLERSQKPKPDPRVFQMRKQS